MPVLSLRYWRKRKQALKLASGSITAVVGAIFTLGSKSDPEKLYHTIKIK